MHLNGDVCVAAIPPAGSSRGLHAENLSEVCIDPQEELPKTGAKVIIKSALKVPDLEPFPCMS